MLKLHKGQAVNVPRQWNNSKQVFLLRSNVSPVIWIRMLPSDFNQAQPIILHQLTVATLIHLPLHGDAEVAIKGIETSLGLLKMVQWEIVS
jgi:hypothetical protein